MLAGTLTELVRGTDNSESETGELVSVCVMVYVSVPVMILPVPTRLALLIKLSSTDAGLLRDVRVERLE